MPVKITLFHPTPFTRACSRYLQKSVTQLLKELGRTKFVVGILLTDDDTIQGLNNSYRNINRPTNVLSFPFATEMEVDLASLNLHELGDIVISLDTALREAEQFNQHLSSRLDWLATHGLLHLLGYDHEISEEAERVMYTKEHDLLHKLRYNRRHTMPKLAINVDHVATIRQARGGVEPDPIAAASLCEMAGASGIVVHLREDRRHIQDRDVFLLRKTVKTKLNLEMGANKEIIDLALDVAPDLVTLVPEKRQELTTEGGLDVIGQKKKLSKVIKRFAKGSIPVSLFIDPDLDQIKASQEIGAKYVEIHTGRYCDALTEEQTDEEFEFIASSAEVASDLGLIVNGGHGLDYHNCGRIAALDVIDELSIGHAVMSRAVFTGLEKAVADMLAIIRHAQSQLF